MYRFLALLIIGIPAASAQAVSPGLKQCITEADDARRLACFDTEVARLAKTPLPVHAAAPVPTPEEKFGAREEVAREAEKQAEPELTKLEAVTTAISTRPRGELVVTLDNGQVWEQVPSGEAFSLKVGDKVTIKSGLLGSFALVGPRGRSMKVKRVK